MVDEYDLEEWERTHPGEIKQLPLIDNLPVSPERFGDTFENMGAVSAAIWRWLHENGDWNKMPVTSFDLGRVADEIIETVIKKNHDYKDAWQALGSTGAAARFVDKAFRFENLSNGAKALVLDESKRDTIADYVGYGLLLLLWLKFHPFGAKPE